MEPQGKIGKYQVLELLGKGAMGVVYKGFDPGVERNVALKIIRKELIGHERAAEIVARFKTEARAGGRLIHPGIVAVYEYGEDEKTAFIAMEFVEGRALGQYLTLKVRFELADTMSIIGQLLDALDYAHEHGVVHRDVKPANVLLTDAKKVKVADFGIARLENSLLTQVGAVIGTPTYMSPEQFMGQKADRRSDLFSAGVVLYEMLAGVRPFDGTADVVMRKICYEAHEHASRIDPAVPPALDEVIAKALNKQPENRFATAREFADALFAAYRRKDGTRPKFQSVEATVLAASAAVKRWPEEQLLALAHLLEPHVGMLAGSMVAKAAAGTLDGAQLVNTLADNVEDEDQRWTFTADAMAVLDGAEVEVAPTPPDEGEPPAEPVHEGPITPDEIDRAAGRLTPYLGPIAQVLAQRTALRAPDVRTYYRWLAEHIEDLNEQMEFLKAV